MKFELTEYHHNISDQALLNDVAHVARVLNKSSLTKKEYAQNGQYGVETICRRFGSWLKVLDLCKLESNQFQLAAANSSHLYTAISNRDLLDDIIRVSKILGKESFSSREYNDLAKYSSSTVFKRFKAWNNALVKVGLRPYKQVSEKRIETTTLFEEIERMWITLGRQPTVSDIKNGYSKYALNTFSRRFGGWRNALEAFVDWIENDTQVIDIKTDQSVGDDTLIQERDFPPPIKHKTKRDINLRLRFLVMKRDNFKCCICGASPAKDSEVELHVDHIIPWSKGGETVIDNLQTLCSKCNWGKSDLLE